MLALLVKRAAGSKTLGQGVSFCSQTGGRWKEKREMRVQKFLVEGLHSCSDECLGFSVLLCEAYIILK